MVAGMGTSAYQDTGYLLNTSNLTVVRVTISYVQSHVLTRITNTSNLTVVRVSICPPPR